MDILNNIDINSIGFVALATFGAVSAVNILWKKLESKENLILSAVFAFAFAFVPADLGNEIVNRVRDAVAVALTLNGAYQFLGGVAKKVNVPGRVVVEKDA